MSHESAMAGAVPPATPPSPRLTSIRTVMMVMVTTLLQVEPAGRHHSSPVGGRHRSRGDRVRIHSH